MYTIINSLYTHDFSFFICGTFIFASLAHTKKKVNKRKEKEFNAMHSTQQYKFFSLESVKYQITSLHLFNVYIFRRVKQVLWD